MASSRSLSSTKDLSPKFLIFSSSSWLFSRISPTLLILLLFRQFNVRAESSNFSIGMLKVSNGTSGSERPSPSSAVSSPTLPNKEKESIKMLAASRTAS